MHGLLAHTAPLKSASLFGGIGDEHYRAAGATGLCLPADHEVAHEAANFLVAGVDRGERSEDQQASADRFAIGADGRAGGFRFGGSGDMTAAVVGGPQSGPCGLA